MRLSVAHLGATAVGLAEASVPPVPVPVLIGAIAPITRQHDGTAHAIPTAGQFDGQIDAYVLVAAPAGVSLDPGTGILTAGPFVYEAAAIGVAAENASGRSGTLWIELTQISAAHGPWPIAQRVNVSGSATSLSATTGAVQPGDMLVIFVDTNGTNTLSVSASPAVGTLITDAVNLRMAADNNTAQVYYYKVTSAAVGVTFSVSHNATVKRINVFNIGPHSFAAGAANFTTEFGSGSVAFPVFNGLPPRSKVFYFFSNRSFYAGTQSIEGTGALPANPPLGDPQNPVHQAEYQQNNEQFLIDVITLTAGGTTPAVTFSTGGTGMIPRGGVAIAFSPDPAPGTVSVPPGQYIRDDNGAGLARSSTLSGFGVDIGTGNEILVTTAQDVDVGHFTPLSGNNGLGRLWVKPRGTATTVTITGYTPAYGVLTDGRNGHGAMVDLLPVTGGPNSGFGVQGFSGIQGNNPAFSAGAVAQVPITLSPGQTLVIARSRDPLFDERNIIRNFMVVHCVDTVPFADQFAPPIVLHPSLKPWPVYRMSDIDDLKFPALSTTGTGSVPDFPSLRSQFAREHVDWISSQWRYGMRAMAGGANTVNYGRDLMKITDPAFAYIVSDEPLDRRRMIAAALIQRGIDNYGAMRSRYAMGATDWLSPDGGHQPGRSFPIILAGHLLGDNAMRDWISINTSPTAATAMGDLGQRAYLNPTIVAATQAPGWTGAGGAGGIAVPFATAMANAPAVPEWIGQAALGGTINPFQVNHVWDSTLRDNYYRGSVGQEDLGGQVLCVLAMGIGDRLGNPAFIDYHARWHACMWYKDDPWRYVGGSTTPRYPHITGAPGGLPETPAGFAARMYDQHAFRGALYSFPAGVNAFNGAT